MNQKKRFKNLRKIHLLKFTLTLWILKKNIRTMDVTETPCCFTFL